MNDTSVINNSILSRLNDEGWDNFTEGVQEGWNDFTDGGEFVDFVTFWD